MADINEQYGLVTPMKVLEAVDSSIKYENVYSFRGDGILTRFLGIDYELDGGMEPGKLYLLGGVKQSAKTAFAINLANNIALDGLGGVAYISLVDSAHTIIRRSAEISGGIDINRSQMRKERVRGERMSEERMSGERMSREEYLDEIRATMTNYEGRRFYAFNGMADGLFDATDIAKLIDTIPKGLDLVIIDDIDVMKKIYMSETRKTGIDMLASGLKELAKRKHCAILCICTVVENSIKSLKDYEGFENLWYLDVPTAKYLQKGPYKEAELVISMKRSEEPAVVLLDYHEGQQKFSSAGERKLIRRKSIDIDTDFK